MGEEVGKARRVLLEFVVVASSDGSVPTFTSTLEHVTQKEVFV
jgi:hypothetical protein